MSTLTTTGLVYTQIMAMKELYVGAAVSRAQLYRYGGRSCVVMEGAAVSLRRLIRNGPNGIHLYLRRYGGYTCMIHSHNDPKTVLVRIDCIEGHTPLADSFN
ncbi:hypothetical protein L211DRAFT_849798 [Terfezia boudieri ATCC MYA-4762]|uniref:Uncharacterized protein n=1 Tax=Terfezia boudieri ATCC MYA-4762 TaxID=1051890 RepID=A0A3N4LZN5_9PEZI|nr:hypothetical protein L211DRAFT_849798 [Terfezia boudieri ATCC MYA-4762]